MHSRGKVSHDAEAFFLACDGVERLAVSDPGSAIRTGESLVEQADHTCVGTARVRARRALSQANAYAGHFDTALRHCKDAVQIGESAGLTVETARARLASLHALSNLGRFDEAIEAGLAARASFVEVGDRELTARADLNLGAVYAMSDDPLSALAYLDRSRPAFVDQIAILAQLDTNRGNALAAIDDYSGAEDAFATAVASFELTEQHLAAAIAEGNRGYLAARRGLVQQALAHFERARRMLVNSEARAHRARLVAEQAEVIAALGMAGEAIMSLELAIPVLRETAQGIEAARANVTLATANFALGRNEAAHLAISAAIETFVKTGLFVELGKAQLIAAGLALQQNDPDSAIELSDMASIHLADRPADMARAALVSARIHLHQENHSAANEAIDLAISIANRLELTPVAADAHLLKGRWMRARGSSALDEFANAVELTEQIRGTLQARTFRSAFQSDRIAPYIELLFEAINGDSDNAPVAFRASELVKSRGLLDLIGGSEEPRGKLNSEDATLHQRIQTVREEVNWQYSRINEGTDTIARHQTIRNLEQELLTLETQFAATSTSTDSGLRPVELDRALAALSVSSLAISYNFVGDELVAIVLAEGECTVHRNLATSVEIDESLRRFRLQVSRAHARGGGSSLPPRMIDDAKRELHQLWKFVIEPIISLHPNASEVIVVPGGALHTVPFSALWDGDHYLIEQSRITIVPSLSIFTRLSQQVQVKEDDELLIVGVADNDAPEIREEVARISAITNSGNVLLDSEATADSVLKRMAIAKSLHFAGHGRFSAAFPQASGLKCVDRWLTLAEITSSTLDRIHITLSACDTARASVQAVEELVGLSSGFYAAGARSMIMTLWPVDDRRTATLMSDCYGQRAAGASFAASLRHAQLNLIRSGEHPAYWAPFTFGGRA